MRAETRHASCRCDGILPLCGSFGSEDPQCRSGDEVALKVETVVNGGVHAEEALGRSSRLEPLQLALASSHCLMRILRPIVVPQPLLMRTGQPETPERRGEAGPLGQSDNPIYCRVSSDSRLCLVQLIQQSDLVRPRG